MENEQAHAGRDGYTRLAKPNSQAKGDREIIFPVQLTTSRIGNLTRLNIMIHTFIVHTTFIKENLNAAKPSEQSKGLGGNIGCKD